MTEITQYAISTSTLVAGLIENAKGDSSEIGVAVLDIIEAAETVKEREERILELQSGAVWLPDFERRKALNTLYESYMGNGHSPEEIQAGIRAVSKPVKSMAQSCESVKQTIMNYRLGIYIRR